MNSKLLNLPDIQSFPEFESFKLNNSDVIELAVQKVIQQHNLASGPLTALEGTNIVYALEADKIIKIYPPIHRDHYISENLVLKFLQDKLSIKTPRLEFEGEISNWPYVVMSKIEGTSLEGLWETLDHASKMILVRELGVLIREVHALSPNGLESIDCHWDKFIDHQINNCVAHHQEMHLPEFLLQQLPEFIAPLKEELKKIDYPVLLTGEYTPMNLIVKQQAGILHIEGLIDFGDSMLGLAEYDLLGPICFLIQGDKNLLRELLNAYGIPVDRFSVEKLQALTRKLTALILLHRYSNLGVQIRVPDWKNKVKSLEDLENLVLGF